MKHLKSYTLFESKSEIMEFIDYLNHDLEDDGFDITQSDSFEFMKSKWKNIRRNDSSWGSRRNEFEFYKGKEVKVFEIATIRKSWNTHFKGFLSSTFNVYDVIPHVRRLLDYAKSLGYNHFEIRKITQMSRRSQDVTSQFVSSRKLGDSAKREIHILQILIMK